MKKIKNILFKNWLLIFCFIIIVLQFSQIIYFNHSIFSQKYDLSYWKDRYEHSQYVLPLSQRIIGDDGLYSYAGYRLINGESIEKTGTFKPPVGIYLLGFSILIFNNPLITSMFIGVITIISFFFLSLELLKDRKLVIMTTTLLVLDPFIFSNFTITLLDLPQLLFLLLHLLFFLSAAKNKNYAFLFALFSGISLGFFAETKLPLLLPVIITLELWYLFKQKLLARFAWIILGFTIGVLIPYFRYLQLAHNLIDYLKLHKYFLSYYATGGNQLFPLSIWQSLFVGYFPNVTTGQLTRIQNWWPILPLVTFIGIISAIKVFLQKNQSIFLKGLAILVFSLLFIYTAIPVYARYLTLVIPFLYIFTATALKKYISKLIFVGIFIVITLFGLFYSSYLLIPSTDNVLQDFKHNLSHQYFQDIYQEDISTVSRPPYSEQQFREITQKAFIDASIVGVNFKELSRSIPLIGNTGQVKFTVTYTTQDLGTFSEEKTLNLVKEQDEWKIQWNWNLLLNLFRPKDSFVLRLSPGKRGTIYDNKKQIFAKDSDSILISINPEKIDTKQEKEILKLLQIITSKSGVNLQNTYLENPLPNTYIPIATPFTVLSQEQLQLLNNYPGLKLESHIARLYREQEAVNQFVISNTAYPEYCSRIYSSSNYHGVSGFEKKYDKELSGYNGGTLQMINKNGDIVRTLINREPKNGKDIVIP